MPTEIRIWRVSQGQLMPVPDASFGANHKETDLEDWIEKNPAILDDDLLVIGRQVPIEGVGRLDLLCIDSDATLVIVELKRDLTPRDAVAQALDYASWINDADESEILGYAKEYLKGQPLTETFVQRFKAEMPILDCKRHRIILAAPRLDASAERIINYLANRYGMDVNAVFFNYVRLDSGEEILARSLLVPDEVREERASHQNRAKFTIAELLAMAEQRGVGQILQVCRQMNTLWSEYPSVAYGGSLSYWVETKGGDRSLFGLNIAGQRKNAPIGNLDVWIPAKNLADASGVDEQTIRRTLASNYTLVAEGKDCLIRLSTAAQAEALVGQLKDWFSKSVSAIT